MAPLVEGVKTKPLLGRDGSPPVVARVYAGWKQTGAVRRRRAYQAVETALRARPDASDTAISEHVGVDHKTVASVRRGLSRELPKIAPAARTVTRGGTVAT